MRRGISINSNSNLNRDEGRRSHLEERRKNPDDSSIVEDNKIDSS